MTNEKVESLLDHLDDLRKRLIIIGITFVIFFFAAFAYSKDILLFFTHDLTTKYHIKLQILAPSETLTIFFKISSIVALICSIPVIATQVWLFVKPALKKTERKVALKYIPALCLSFLSGIFFGYFLIFPFLLKFVIEFGQGLFYIQYTPSEYFNYLFYITIPFGVLFELPLLSMLLTSIGLINPLILSKSRKIAYFTLVIVACMISPPDFFAHISVSIPLILLFEISVLTSRVVYKKTLKKEAESVKNFEE